MFVIEITNDEPDECELWGPYYSEQICKQVIEAYICIPESVKIKPFTESMLLAITDCPF